jgi:hypothetical protein
MARLVISTAHHSTKHFRLQKKSWIFSQGMLAKFIVENGTELAGGVHAPKIAVAHFA